MVRRFHSVTSPPQPPPQTQATGTTGDRAHRKLGLAIIVAASVLAFFSVFALWANRQVLNTDNWTESSSKLLENDDVRGQVAGYLVDQAYANTDVTAQVQAALPPRAAPIAAPVAGALREFANRAANQLLERPRVQALWEQANRRAHTRFLQVVNGGGPVVSTQNGDVTLDLRELLGQAEQRIGVGGRVQQKLPPDAAQLKIMDSDNLELAQDSVHLLRALAIALPAIAILLLALAVYLARGWRREALRAAGIGLALAGAAALVFRTLAGDAVVNSLVSTETVRPAAAAVWDIETSLLQQAAVATLAYGVVVAFAAWLAGPTGAARSIRSTLAPYLREPRFAWGGFAVIVLLLLVWGPTPATRQAITALILIGLLALGTEALRRQTAREYPDATLAAASQRRRERMSQLAGQMRRDRGPQRADAFEGARLDRVEQLGRLRDSGAIDEAEFQREKSALLNGPKAG
jgi:hypothetical protein